MSGAPPPFSADGYGRDRILLPGDAVHTMVPTGGYGMNTGPGDAFNLGWKLAAVVNGWGGRRLLDSYEPERRPIGERNRDASVENAGVHLQYHFMADGELLVANTPAAAAHRAVIAEFPTSSSEPTARYSTASGRVSRWSTRAGTPKPNV